MVPLRVGLGAQLGHRLAIHLNPSGGNQFFRFAPRCDAGGSHNLLQTLRVSLALFIAGHDSVTAWGSVTALGSAASVEEANSCSCSVAASSEDSASGPDVGSS